MFKAGFVNIIGNPNVGKSTLMNALVGEKLSIITPKAQTTRHRILGILNGDNYQIVFSDLPGILKPAYKLQEKMMKFIGTAITDADIFLYMVEAGEARYDEGIVKIIKDSGMPVFILINKIDLSTQEKVIRDIGYWSQIFNSDRVIPLSALNNFNVKELKEQIIELLPEHEPYYPKDDLTDRSVRFFVSEIIREKIMTNYRQEIPYSVEVVVNSFIEEEKLIRIDVSIFVARETQKMIILGSKGSSIKKMGTLARKDIEKFVGKKVYLEITVKISKDWRDNEKQLKKFGYE
jgi:GTP-binding protein Era